MSRPLIIGTVASGAILVLLPVGYMIYSSFAMHGFLEIGAPSLSNYRAFLSATENFDVVLNTILFGLGTVLIALPIGTFLGWIVERTDIPLKNIIRAASIVPYLVPGTVDVLSWILMLSPGIGVLNRVLMQIFGLSEPPLSIYSFYGAILVEGVHTAPVVFLLMSSAFRSVGADLEEAARVSGSGIFFTFFHVTLKVTRPAILSAVLFILARQLGVFGTPKLLLLPAGIKTLPVVLWGSVRGADPQYGVAAVLAVVAVLIAAILVLFYRQQLKMSERYAVITGRNTSRRTSSLGPSKYILTALGLGYLFFGAGLPISLVFWLSLLPFYTTPSLEAIGKIGFANFTTLARFPFITRAILNTLLLSTLAATAVVIFAFIVSWVATRVRARGSSLPEALTSIPLAVPPIAYGLAILLIYVWTPIYATIWVLLVAYITLGIPVAVRYSSPAIVQISKELEDSSRIAGANWIYTFFRINIPLLLPSLIAGWLHVFVVTIRELSASVLLATSGSEVLPVVLFELVDQGEFPQASALGILLVIMSVGIYFALRKIAGLRYHW